MAFHSNLSYDIQKKGKILMFHVIIQNIGTRGNNFSK